MTLDQDRSKRHKDSMCSRWVTQTLKKKSFIVPGLKNQKIDFQTITATEKMRVEIMEGRETKREDQNYVCSLCSDLCMTHEPHRY